MVLISARRGCMPVQTLAIPRANLEKTGTRQKHPPRGHSSIGRAAASHAADTGSIPVDSTRAFTRTPKIYRDVRLDLSTSPSMVCLGPCGKDKPDQAFELRPSGRRRNTCLSCRSKAYANANLEERRAYFRQYNNQYRRDNPHVSIYRDSRRSDREAGLGDNDLDPIFVEEAIRSGCSYCGEVSLRMTLDRIDNDRSHTKTNVNPSCIRCNLLRGSMPYVAWLHLVPAVREARELGLFDEWRSRRFTR